MDPTSIMPCFYTRSNRYIVDYLNRELIEAAIQNKMYLVGWLIDLGAEVDARNDFENSAIARAAQKNADLAIEVLVKYGAKTNDLNTYDMTPLMSAAGFDTYQAVVALLKAPGIFVIKQIQKGKRPYPSL